MQYLYRIIAISFFAYAVGAVTSTVGQVQYVDSVFTNWDAFNVLFALFGVMLIAFCAGRESRKY